MARIAKSAATLRIGGNDLVPDEITQVLGCRPTHAEMKGEEITGKTTGNVRVATSGLWRIKSTEREPADLDSQIAEIFDRLSSNLAVWKGIASQYHVDLFVGLFLNKSMEGLEISADSLRILCDRGVKLGLDVYGPYDEDDD